MSIRRQVKNVVKNFSNAEVLVREATSNDPWGPSSSVMTEIADATYNVVAFSEIMGMIWKRLNDHGKNWRHVYKSLVLLDYIIKTGSERVAQQCRENIFAIQTLKDFQFIDKDGKDQGMNVREKAKQLVALLKDEERMKSERARALKAKERFAQASSGIGSDSSRAKSSLRDSGSTSDIRFESTTPATTSVPTSRSWEPERKAAGSELENCRPSNTNEEELQLQLALALSKQEAEEYSKLDERENQRLQLALDKSQPTGEPSLLHIAGSHTGPVASSAPDPWGTSQVQTAPQPDPWGAAPSASDPWGSAPAPVSQPQVNAAPDPWGAGLPAAPVADPWGGTAVAAPAPPVAADPWASPQFQQQPQAVQTSQPNPWGAPSNGIGFSAFNETGANAQPFPAPSVGILPSDPFNLSSVNQSLPSESAEKTKPQIGDDLQGLVNLDSLTSKTPQVSNPFVLSSQAITTKSTNPFMQDKPQPPTLNQLRGGGIGPAAPNFVAGGGSDVLLPAPLAPNSSTQTVNNPFL